MKPVVAANWKMHKTVEEAVDFSEELIERLAGFHGADVVIAPPATALARVSGIFTDTSISTAGQNLHWMEKGAFTGEISPAMLIDAGCSYALVGHSERRTLFGETDEMVNLKIKAALAADLIPIFCLGENLKERESGNTFNIVEKQLKEGLNNIESDDIGNHCVIAYEPVWAIGTGETATSRQAEEVHSFIRDWIRKDHGENAGAQTRIIYGGSVNGGNAADLMKQPNINGVLVGGASLEVESFMSIVRSC